MERRELLKILAATLAVDPRVYAQHAHWASSSTAVDFARYKPRFLSAGQYEMVDRLVEILVPSDEQSPGAHQAGVPFYVDTVLYFSGPEVKQSWVSGLNVVEETAAQKFGKAFVRCSPEEQQQIVGLMAQNEASPRNELENFFGTLKQLTLEGYVLSDVGMRDYLGYKGNTELAQFLGCTHPEHQD